MSELVSSLMSGGLALLVGVALAVVAAVRLRRGSAPAPTSERLEDVNERLGYLVAHLRELGEQEGRLSSDVLAAERLRLEGQAAELLRQRDALKEEPVASPAAPMGFLARRPELRGALWGGGVVAIAALLFALVVSESTPSAPMSTSQEASAPDPEVQALLTHLRKQPEDVSALVRLGHLLLRGQMLAEAKVVTDRALQYAPDNLEALTHSAVIGSASDMPAALKALDQVLDKDPKFAEAWLFRGMMGMRSGDTALMRQSFQQFVAHAPEGPQRERIRAMLEQQATP